MNSLSITLVLCLSGVSSMASAHGGGVDGQGGHNRSAGNYHFHRGPLDGRTYASKEEAAKALSANSPGVANEAATDSNRSTELPLFDLAPYRPYQFSDAQVIAREAYIFQYSEAHEQAAWVLYRITAEQLQASVSRTDDFRRDGAVTTGSATLADYRSSGYDRGHLAPAAAMAWSQEVMSESFYLSNMSPQDPGFNRGIWRQLEARVRDWADLHGEVFVVTGPVLEDELPTIGPSGVSVPAYYYKVVVDLRPPGVEGIGFILPNGSADQSIGRYAVSIDSVEAFTGIDFFPLLSDSIETELEITISGDHWGFQTGTYPP
jgi:DNA/RNA endonuclease G (NUC1)